MDRFQNRSRAVDAPLASDQDEEATIRLMLRLYEDLGSLADAIDPDDSVCLHIVQTPERLLIQVGGNTPDIVPVLAAVL